LEALTTVDQMREQTELADTLMKRYRNDVAAKYGLSEDLVDDILMEAREENWPFPKFDDALP
jgi:hypothetical protein